MKIVHCIYSLNTGGTETMLIDIANEQCKTCDTWVIIVNRSYQQYLIDQFDQEVRLVFLNRKEGSKSLIPIFRLNLLLWKIQPDAIHVHNYSFPKIILPIFRNLFFTAHCLGLPTAYLHRMKCTFAISEAVKTDLQQRGGAGFPIKVIPNGISVDKILRRSNNDKHDPFRIVQVGSLYKDIKGQDILIEAIATLKNKGISNIQVDFIGAGHSERELKQQTQNMGVNSQVNFLGLKDRKYIYSHLKDYDLMCHPSRTEGFGLTVAEGMAAKLPVLVSDSGGPFEIIGRGRYGYSFLCGDSEDCANMIDRIMRSYPAALASIEPALTHVQTRYSVSQMVQDYIKHYKNI